MFDFLNKFRERTRCRSGDLPPEVCDYLKACETRISPSALIKEARFIVLDTEATGLNIKSDQLLSIGAVAVNRLRIDFADSFEAVIKNEMPAVKETVIIHGIMPGEARNGLEVHVFLNEFLKYIKNDIIVAHHAAFDITMINRSLKHIYGIELRNPVLDTAAIYRRLEHSFHSDHHEIKPEEYSLDRLAEKYRIHTSDRHTAWGDALITAVLLQKLIRQAEDRKIIKLNDLLKSRG